jgi:type II secretory pathway pseudopilin PulG
MMITPDSKGLGERKVILWIARLVSYFVYFYLIVVEVILLIGFFLLLFGANPTAGFTEWAYRNLDRVMDPFRGIFSPIELGTTGNDVEATFDTSVLFAMIVYGILALVLGALISWLTARLRQIQDAEMYNRTVADLAAQQARIDERQATATGTPAPTPPSDGVPPPPPPAPRIPSRREKERPAPGEARARARRARSARPARRSAGGRATPVAP